MTEEQVKGLLSLGRVERAPAVACDLGSSSPMSPCWSIRRASTPRSRFKTHRSR